MDRVTDPFAITRARRALQQAKLPFSGEVVAANSTRNEVLICGDYVVRINREPNQRLRREAQLVAELPIRSWTPRIIGHGGDIGADYLIVARRPGQPLSRCWPTMTPRDRRFAIAQLAEALDDLHHTATPTEVLQLTRTTHLLDDGPGLTLRPLWQAIGTLRRNGRVDQRLLDLIEETTSERAHLFDDFSTEHLVHGDLTFENILWDGRQITALLDFEWCRGGPAELDLDSIARYCRYPFAHVPEPASRQQHPQDYANVWAWLTSDLPELFEGPHLADRLLVIDIAFELHELIAHPDLGSRRELGPLHPLNRLEERLRSLVFQSDLPLVAEPGK